jgi:Protein of unknown function (DUF550)
MSDHHQFLARQVAFGRMAFGPGERREGVLDHIAKEMGEVRVAETHEARAEEWVDLVILSQDGLLRCVREMIRASMAEHAEHPMIFSGTEVVARHGEPTADYVAKVALTMLTGKRDKNELRNWPDWRGKSEDVALEHERGTHD